MAVDITITISNKENEILEIIATRNGKTVAKYCENIVKGWAESQIRGIYQREFNKKTLSELIDLFGNIY